MLPLLLVGCGSKIEPQKLLAQKSEKIEQTIVENWSFRQLGNTDWMPATVPGTVHTDLFANKVIENPFYSTNEANLQWIEEKDWEYRSKFRPTSELLKADVQQLIFKGLDTYADIYLNEELLLSADNMFLEWTVDVSGKLLDGENTITVRFSSAYNKGLELANKLPIKLPADNDKGKDAKTSVFTRKAPYHFGWDWGPRFVTVGVWRPVFIEGWNRAKINTIQYVQKSQSNQKADFDANFTVDAVTEGKFTLVVADTAGKVYAQQSVTLTKGENKFTLPFAIENPSLWYPNGMGEPNLYSMVAILAAGDKKYDQKNTRIGVRTVRLVQQPDAQGDGKSFYFEVNGQPVFAKGANYIPQDVFTPRVATESYLSLIETTKMSNMNMLRVWGGGIYEEDLFYELCDENGIMVWQDFMFACSFYPWDKEFFESVTKEVKYNVGRLRNHPSIVLWCGNNEIDEAWYHWGYQKVYGWDDAQQKQIKDGIDSLFRHVIPRALYSEDTTRFYHPSSPLYGRGNPRSQIEGDVHYWGVFHDEEPFSVYKDKPGRFSNEYGFQSLACYDTYREFFKSEDMRLYSPAMVVHQKNPKGYRVMEEYMVRDLPLLKNDFRTYIYLTQLLQAEGIKIAMEGHRQKRPWTMGSLYWQLNDCWPVASWSSMDSEGRWKALQYYARRSFEPSMVSFEKIDSTQTVKLWGLNDRLEDVDYEGTLTLMDFDGKVLWRENSSGKIPANSNIELLHSTDKELLQGADPSKVMLVAEGKIDGKPTRVIYYFVPLKNLKLPKADFEVTYSQDGNQVRANLKANKLLKSILFSAEKLQNNPSDAYFDMLPGEEREIILDFKGEYPINELGIFLTTLNELVGKSSAQPIKDNVK